MSRHENGVVVEAEQLQWCLASCEKICIWWTCFEGLSAEVRKQVVFEVEVIDGFPAYHSASVRKHAWCSTIYGFCMFLPNLWLQWIADESGYQRHLRKRRHTFGKVLVFIGFSFCKGCETQQVRIETSTWPIKSMCVKKHSTSGLSLR